MTSERLLPTQLRVVWLNATRGGAAKSRVELDMEQRLIDLHGSVEEAALCRADYIRKLEPPGHEWVRKYCQAQLEATKGLLPSERRAELRLTFIL